MFSGGPEEDPGLPPEAIVLGHGTAVDGRNAKQPSGMSKKHWFYSGIHGSQPQQVTVAGILNISTVAGSDR